MGTGGRRGAADPVEHGFPHLETVRDAIAALHRRLSYETLRTWDASLSPAEVAFADDDELHLGVQQVAAAVVRHYRLPEARVIVSFREMEHAANVELEAGPEYFVELNTRFKAHRRDVGAALAHEVAHVLLHRLDLAFGTVGENEILTDTAAAYLGAGWLLLDAFRQDALTSQKLGYLTPEEFGYVLAKRAELNGEDPAVWFTSPQAYDAYAAGRTLAARDRRQPPLTAAGWTTRARYAMDRKLALAGRPPVPQPDAAYAFDAGSPPRVSFRCPTCLRRIRIPVRGRVRARCSSCRSVLECDA
ncbi:hypothetical protein [Streptomyces sulphureus]|uniref:hypothetical protein n=1 Tax=Streptomyces sulphureus TaxID=47758 RepID=UPI00037A137A|nr:hypothetical protein [Streptomyces sulphureus]